MACSYQIFGDCRPFQFLDKRELAVAMTTEQAAAHLGKSVRTIRRWCQEDDIGARIGGGPYLIHPVLLELKARAPGELRAYLRGRPLTETVIEAFDRHGLYQALIDAEDERMKRAKRRPQIEAAAAIAAIAAKTT